MHRSIYRVDEKAGEYRENRIDPKNTLITEMKTPNMQTNEKGFSRRDPFLSYIKNYDCYYATADNGMELYHETHAIPHALFPDSGSSPNKNLYFRIEHQDQTLRIFLHNYFTDKRTLDTNNLYGDGIYLDEFFENVAHELLVTGHAYYFIEWSNVNFGEKNYQLPISFRHLSPESMKTFQNNGTVRGYRQTRSLTTYLKEHKLKYINSPSQRSFDFYNDEIIFYKYPFANTPPTAQCLKFLRHIKAFWKFCSNQLQGNIDIDKPYLPQERARYASYLREKQIRDISRNRIRTAFHFLRDFDGAKTTDYYDAYTTIRYKKRLNDFRDYLVQEFNKQVFDVVAHKNDMELAPKLTYSGFVSNALLDKGLQQHSDGIILDDEFNEKFIRPL